MSMKYFGKMLVWRVNLNFMCYLMKKLLKLLIVYGFVWIGIINNWISEENCENLFVFGMVGG